MISPRISRAWPTIGLGLLLVSGFVAYGPPAAAQAPGHMTTAFVEVGARDLRWEPIAPPGFDPGMEIAVVHGDPGAAGEAYTLRLRFPDGYRFPPHWHPVTENVTVLEGTFLLAMGERTDEARIRSYAPGDYLYIEGRHPHYGGATGRTVIQLHGTGPFDIVVVGSPEDIR
jgi:quercetin dioxygenase-like cupin family protein